MRDDGTAWAWGLNTSGQVGDGTTTQRKTPVMVEGLSGVIGVAAGQNHSLAVRQDGAVYAWGSNGSGQLGDGTTSPRSSPTLVSGLTNIVAVAAGANHSLALRADGIVFAWGKNTNGQLGDTTTTQRTTPVQVVNLVGVAAIAAGEAFSLAVLADGTVWAWGLNTNGQVGDGTTTQRLTPVRAGTLSGIVQVAAGRSHALALAGNGAVSAWGLNSQGQLGDGTTTQRTSAVTVGGVTAASMAAGSYHSLAVGASGVVSAWGYNATGQLGDGTAVRKLTPVTLATLPPVDQVAGGDTHSLALTPDDAVWTWGGNGSGQLGDGTTTGQLQPTPVSGGGLTWGVAAPTATPSAGTFSTDQSVTLSTVTPGATMRYTTTGVDPTDTDAVFVSGTPIVVDRTLTLKAKAWKTGLTPSPVMTRVYTLRPVTPTMTPAGGGAPYTSPQEVTLATTTPGATVRYTIDGSEPTETSAAYTVPFTVATGLTIKAVAFKPTWSPSATASTSYTFDYGTLAPPVATPAGGTYTTAQTVVLTVSGAAMILYSLDGSEPVLGAPGTAVYVGPLAMTSSVTLRARAIQADWSSSESIAWSYAITGTLESPSATPPEGQYTFNQTVQLSAQDAATIRYTINGSEPTEISMVYTGPFLVDSTTTVKARAYLDGWLPSPTLTAHYLTPRRLRRAFLSPIRLPARIRPPAGELVF